MPYTFQEFSVPVSQSGLYSLESSWNLPLYSLDPNAYLYDKPLLRYQISTFPPGFISQSVETYPKYPDFATITLLSGLTGTYHDEFKVEYARGLYNQGQRFNTIPTESSGEIAIRQFQIKFNYEPCILMIIFRGRYIFTP